MSISEVLKTASARVPTENSLWAVKETLRRLAQCPDREALRSQTVLLDEIDAYVGQLQVAAADG